MQRGVVHLHNVIRGKMLAKCLHNASEILRSPSKYYKPNQRNLAFSIHKIQIRFVQKQSNDNLQKSGVRPKKNNWAVYFFSLSAAIVAGMYYSKEKEKFLMRKQFEEKCEAHKDKTLTKMVSYGGYFLPDFVKRSLKDIKDFQLRDTDILVVSFPKSGTTWMQQIVYSIENGINSEVIGNMEERFPYLEYVYPGLKHIKNMQGVRLLKSHLPYSLLPEDIRIQKAKIIYMVRNPKDVSVSYYHYARMLNEVKYRGTFREFFDKFTSAEVPYGPWWNHVAGFYLHHDDSNILIIAYEDLKENPVKVISMVAEFLGKQLSDDEKLQIAAATSFHNMACDPNSNYSWWDDLGIRDQHESKFFRKGEVGDWRNYFDEEMSDKMDAIVKKYLHPLGLCITDTVQKSS